LSFCFLMCSSSCFACKSQSNLKNKCCELHYKCGCLRIISHLAIVSSGTRRCAWSENLLFTAKNCKLQTIVLRRLRYHQLHWSTHPVQYKNQHLLIIGDDEIELIMISVLNNDHFFVHLLDASGDLYWTCWFEFPFVNLLNWWRP
jgi:hypothetical protein